MTATPLYIRSRGKVLGPFSSEQLQLLRDRGQLRRFHEVSQDRQTWVPATSLTDLFPPDSRPLSTGVPNFAVETGVSSAAMPPPGPEGYRTSPTESESVRDGWRHVRAGLGLVLLSNYIWLGGAGIVLIGTLLMVAEGAAASSTASGLREETGIVASLGLGILFLLGLWLLIQVVATILQLVGHGFCLMVAPRRDSGVKALAVTVFVLASTALVLSVLTRMSSFAFFHRDPLAWALLGGQLHVFVYLLDVATFCLLLFFLRSVAAAVGDKILATNLIFLLASWGSFCVVAVVLVFLLLLMVGNALFEGSKRMQEEFRVIGPFALFILGVLGCVGLALYVWFLIALHQTRGAVGRYLSILSG